MQGRMPTIYYGNTCKVVELAGYGVKVIINDKGMWYYSVQDVFDAAGEDFHRDVQLPPGNIIRAPGARFYYGDLRAMDVLLNQVIGTDKSRSIWESIKL